MSTRIVVLMLCLSILGACASARARREALTGIREGTGGLTTVQDRPLRLAFIIDLNPDCTPAGDPIVQLTEEPANGKTVVSKIKDYTNFSNDNQRSTCNKEKRLGLEILYQPNPGFSGTDRVSADVIFPQGFVHRNHYNITVR